MKEQITQILDILRNTPRPISKRFIESEIRRIFDFDLKWCHLCSEWKKDKYMCKDKRAGNLCVFCRSVKKRAFYWRNPEKQKLRTFNYRNNKRTTENKLTRIVAGGK